MALHWRWIRQFAEQPCWYGGNIIVRCQSHVIIENIELLQIIVNGRFRVERSGISSSILQQTQAHLLRSLPPLQENLLFQDLQQQHDFDHQSLMVAV